MLQNNSCIPRHNAVRDIIQNPLLNGTERPTRLHGRNRSGAKTLNSIEQCLSVAHRAVSHSSYKLKSVRLCINLLFNAHLLKPGLNSRQTERAKVMSLTSRDNGFRDFVNIRCSKNKNGMRRGLLETLKQGIKRRDAQHVHLVDDVYFSLISCRRKRLKRVHQLSNIFDAIVRGSVNLTNREARTGADLFTRLTFETRLCVFRRLAINRLGKDPRYRSFSNSPRTSEEIRMHNFFTLQRVGEGAGYVILTTDGTKN